MSLVDSAFFTFDSVFFSGSLTLECDGLAIGQANFMHLSELPLCFWNCALHLIRDSSSGSLGSPQLNVPNFWTAILCLSSESHQGFEVGSRNVALFG